MSLSNNYFEDEIRDGFYIPGMVKRSWGAQMTVLKVVDKICKKHNLRWFADFGTLIGAVRHEGFIPWDDDLDISMFREDYEKLKIYLDKELPKGYEYLCFENEPEYKDFLLRVTNSHGINLGNEFLKENCGFPYTAGIDIFAMDYVYADPVKEEERINKIKKIWDIASDISEGKPSAPRPILDRQIEDICGYSMNPRLDILPALRRVLEKIFSECDGTGSTMVALMPKYFNNVKRKMPISCYSDIVELPFEDMTVNVPAIYEDVMANVYGKWEIGKKAGGVHGYPFFREQETILENENKVVPYKYYFTLPTAEDISKRSEHKSKCDSQMTIVTTLKKVIPVIFASIKTGDYMTAGEFLQSSQNLAIQLGNQWESQYRDCSFAVKLLEDYCELIFSLYNLLAENNAIDVEAYKKEFENSILYIDKAYNELKDASGDILFVLSRAKDWKYVKPLYDKYSEDSNYNVYVTVAPYAYRDNCGNVGEYIYEDNDLPDYVNVIAYDAYPFGTNHAAKIIITNPFDEFKSGMTQHGFFYASNLYQYADELVYVQSFELDDFTDEKSYENAKTYILTPGVSFADKVIVPSEFMKNVYVKVLTENSNKDTEFYDSKLEVLAINKATEESRDVKKLLFFVSLSDILEGKDKALLKLKESIEMLESVSEPLKVDWYIDTNMRVSIEKISPALSSELEAILDKFCQKNNFRIIEREKRDKVLEETDGYFGSGGYLFNQCVQRGIPVMLRNRMYWT